MEIAISIVIPCFNSGRFLKEAVKSVQSYKGINGYEIIIVDDGSTDAGTSVVLKEMAQAGCTVIYQENKGPGAARNAGCLHAKGKYFLFLDSDNKIVPDYIDTGIDYLKQNAALAAVYGNAIFFGENLRTGFQSAPFNIQSVLAINYVDVCAVVRREAWQSVGGFDEDRELIGREDWELWIRLYRKGWQFQYVNQDLFYYRIREGSLMSKHTEHAANLMYVYRKHYDLLAVQYIEAVKELAIQKKDLKWSIRHLAKQVKGRVSKTGKN